MISSRPSDDITALDLDLLIDVVDSLGLNINKMSGIATDGAAVMVGSKSGIVTRLKSLNPAILSTHCIAHRLALGSCGAADQIPYLIKYQEILNCIYKYFENSPKNLNKLKYIQNIMSENGTRFKQISGTRWLSFDGAVQAVLRNYSSLVTVLIEDNTPKIAGLLKSITSIKFLYCTYFLSDVLAVLCRLSKCYQKNDIMFSNVNPLLQSSIDQLKVIASGTSGPNFSKFQNLIPSDIVLDQFGEASFIFEDQLIRDGFKQRGDAQTSCNKFVVNVINNLNARFEVKGDAVVLSNLCKIFDVNSRIDGTFVNNIVDYLNLLEIDTFTMSEEIMSFRNYVQCCDLGDITITAICQFAATKGDMFPSICAISKRLLTIPVATADCERGFSRQNIIKNKYRNCLKTNTLCNLMVLSIGKVVTLDFEKAFKKWASAKQRRIL
ncbi:hypothetical protein SNE40_021979 [Patella caerulea]|uniref:HAT C-terminal dimerisation domain-containing protein n=1 Tax=Patella caerulea TaxID=87958 RepID=A0AAN8GCA6_PATCE